MKKKSRKPSRSTAASTSVVKKAPVGMLAALFGSVKRNVTRLEQLADEAEAIADRVLGTEQHRVKADRIDQPDRPTTLESTSDRLQDERIALARIQDVLKRLQQL